MAGLKLQAVTKSWDGKTQVIKPLTLDVADGEFIVMVGPSGCGKSTLLRMVAGLERVTTGDIWIDRKRVTEMEPKDRGIAMVFQNYALYPHMTVRENLAFGLKLSKLPKDQIDAQVNEAAKILELEELLDRLPRQLSGGQAQRVAVARALLNPCSLLLLDEPAASLDAHSEQRVMEALNAASLRQTTLMVTHQLEDLADWDVIWVMQDGRIIEQGRYAGLSVAGGPFATLLAHRQEEI